MSQLKKLIRNLKQPWSWSYSHSENISQEKTVQIGKNRGSPAKKLIPESVWIDVRYEGIPGDKGVTVQSHHTSGERSEISLYDPVHLNREMQAITDQLGHSRVDLVCWRAPQASKEFANTGLTVAVGGCIYSKKFPLLESGAYVRTTQTIHGIPGVLSIDSAQTGWVAGYDILPYGGRVGKGLRLEDVQPFFAQVRAPGSSPHIMLSHSRFWQERGVDPGVGGVVRGTDIHFASIHTDLSTASLGDDIRTGKIQLPIVYNAVNIGTWVSIQYEYVDRINNIISIQFIR